VRQKDYVVVAILAWLLWPKPEEQTSVNIQITEPGMEDLSVLEEFSY